MPSISYLLFAVGVGAGIAALTFAYCYWAQRRWPDEWDKPAP